VARRKLGRALTVLDQIRVSRDYPLPAMLDSSGAD
jgi:hypothetical protein